MPNKSWHRYYTGFGRISSPRDICYPCKDKYGVKSGRQIYRRTETECHICKERVDGSFSWVCSDWELIDLGFNFNGELKKKEVIMPEDKLSHLTGFFRKEIEDLFPQWLFSIGINNNQISPLIIYHPNGLHSCKSLREVFDFARKNRSDINRDTPVICTWVGKWRSDVFKFTIGDLIDYAGEDLVDSALL